MEVSEREGEVLAALGAHLTNAQIATRLHLSVRTVEGYVSSLLRKYGVADRRELTALAGSTSEGLPPAIGQVVGLPTARTSFVGRAGERQAIATALESTAMITLLGPGGVGKTRLATVVAEQVAPAFPFGGAFVDLVPVQEGYLVQSVATALGVVEHPQQSLQDAVVDRLRRGRSLLILDNCEHLLDAVAAFADHVLASCPHTSVLATSRERLGIPGEKIVHIGPLVLGSEAEALFHDRAMAADPDFAADEAVVADLCSRLDGLPLAIELAAARSASLGANALLTGLGDYLRLLAGGRGHAVRHRSLRAVLDWSHQLLDDEERMVLRRLAVFAGGFDLAAVTAVAGAGDHALAADVLGRLVDKSLVSKGGTDRWRLLETIRAFADDQLRESGERDEVARVHLQWTVTQAESLVSRLHGDWQDAFDVIADDLRAALNSEPQAHQLARLLGQLTCARRFVTEAIGHYQQAAQYADADADAAADLANAAECAQVVHDTSRAVQWQLAAAQRFRAAADANSTAIHLARAVELATRFPATVSTELTAKRARELVAEAQSIGDSADPTVAAQLAIAAAWSTGAELLDPDPGLAAAAVAAARAAGNPILICASLDAVRTSAMTAGRVRQAYETTMQRLELLSAMDPADPRAAPEVEDTIALACSDSVAVGDLPGALAAVRQVLGDDGGDHPYLAYSKVIPALVLAGDLATSRHYAALMWDGWERAGQPPAVWLLPAAHFAALAHGLSDDHTEFTGWRDRSARLCEAGNVFAARHAPLMVFIDARVAIHTGQLGEAADLVDAALAAPESGRFRNYCRAVAVELAVVAKLPTAAGLLDEVSTADEHNDWAAACLMRARGRLHNDPVMLMNAADRWDRLGARFEHNYTLSLVTS